MCFKLIKSLQFLASLEQRLDALKVWKRTLRAILPLVGAHKWHYGCQTLITPSEVNIGSTKYLSTATTVVGAYWITVHRNGTLRHKCTDVDMECTWSKSMCIAYADSQILFGDFCSLSQTFRRLSQTFRRLSQIFRRLVCPPYADSENICAYMLWEREKTWQRPILLWPLP